MTVSRLVIEGGQVFDGTGAPARPAEIAVEGERIVAVGARLEGEARVDAAGFTVTPGFIDVHVHSVMSGFDRMSRLDAPFSYQFFEAVRNLELLLDRGITTIRDAGGADLGVKAAVEDGLIKGPELLIAITLLGQTGGHTDGWNPSGVCAPVLAEHPGRPSMVVDGADEMRRRVRELVRAGADVIKLCTSGGVLSPRSDPDRAHLDHDEIETAVAEADRAGIAVMAHAMSSAGIKNAIRAGVRSIEHAIYLDDEAIQLALDHGAWIVPTLLAPVLLLERVEAGAQVIGSRMEHKARAIAEHHMASIGRAVEAGVPIAMGTDSGVFPHGPNLRELHLLTEAGMSPEAALHAATGSAAALLGRTDIGRVAPGARADLAFLRGELSSLDGLEDRVAAVMSRGAFVRNETGRAPRTLSAESGD